jgi:DNA-binding MarR family transcriptional regulator
MEPIAAADAIELDRVLAFMQLLWSVDHGLQSASKRMKARLGITGPQRLVVRILGRTPGMGAGQLAAVLRVHPSTLTGVLKRLQARGLIERLDDPEDNRRARFRLTREGRAVDRLRAGTAETVVRRVVERLPPKQLAAAEEALAAVAAALERVRS